MSKYVVSNIFDPNGFYSTITLFVVEMEYRSIRIRKETYQALKKLGSSLDDTYDSVIRNLILKEKES